MHDFIPGQRWISDTESQMGLGTILAVEHRSVTVHFLATGESRTYARASAPLTRVMFSRGDHILSHEGWSLQVEAITEEDGLLTYRGIRDDGNIAQLEESQLDSFIQLNRPMERLFNGQIDPDKWFELRYQTLQHLNRLSHSDLYGLIGARTSLIPHQLYIAHEVANRYAPRVLLADEVGLGKTIEAGLILHQQLLTERARRVLIVVPESLVHQWLVEMLRRFNLYFSLFDEERCLAAEESTDQANPFHTEQLVICNLAFLTSNSLRFAQALEGDWDLLVVDEAHHLQWSESQASIEYSCVEQLAAKTPGVLLLTATPEQLGKASHFARLRLLDPDRFPDYAAFLAEENNYAPVAEAVEVLLNDQPLNAAVEQVLRDTIQEGDNQELLADLRSTPAGSAENHQARTALVEHLLDRHGTGRILFRNTRAAIKGFPGRRLVACPLPLPDSYANCLAEFQTTTVTDTHLLLCPEVLYQTYRSAVAEDWTRFDPRIDWLTEHLRQLRPAKVLVITASADSVMDIAEALRSQAGIHAAVFHEQMSIIERDRAAAYFADTEFGSQVLICSEIGSEGRNFQFAHHLILFDLPLNPDLLEQRIGRLDRIGQTQTIHIHVPYLQGSPQEVLFSWYHEGLGAFEHTCPAGHNVYVEVQQALLESLHQIDTGIDDLPALITATRQCHQQMNRMLEQGRDRLLEYNSCRPYLANALKERALAGNTGLDILAYTDALFDCFGIDSEIHGENSQVIQPGDHMQVSSLPALASEGMTITCDRDTALANEDMHFISWEHPLVSGAMEMVTSNELGNSALAAIKYRQVKPGSMLLECLYILEPGSGTFRQSSRYLPPSTIRIVIDTRGRNHDTSLSPDAIRTTREEVPPETAHQIIRTYEKVLRQMLTGADALANRQTPEMLAAAQQRVKQTLQREINRLKALRRINPNVRAEEIRFFEQRWQEVTDAIASARLRLDALRVLVVT